MKCWGFNQAKLFHDLYEKTHKTLLKDIKGQLSEWRDNPCSWPGRLSIVKIPNWAMNSMQLLLISQQVHLWVLTSWLKALFAEGNDSNRWEIIEGEEQNWETDTIWLHNLLQCYSYQESMISSHSLIKTKQNKIAQKNTEVLNRHFSKEDTQRANRHMKRINTTNY